MKLSVVMPCYNEQATVGTVVERVLAQPFDVELLAVDDASTDGTLDLLRGIARRERRLTVLAQDRNRGKGAALRRGFRAARGDVVLVQDADLEYDPDDYARLLEPIVAGRADVVYGSRFLVGPHRVLKYWHSVINKALTTLSNMATGLDLTDMETCYKVFRREVIQSLVLEEDRFGFEPEVTAKVARIPGIRIYEEAVSYSGRTYEEGKKIGAKDAVRAVYVIGKYAVWRRPTVSRRQPPAPLQLRPLLSVIDGPADAKNRRAQSA